MRRAIHSFNSSGPFTTHLPIVIIAIFLCLTLFFDANTFAKVGGFTRENDYVLPATISTMGVDNNTHLLYAASNSFISVIDLRNANLLEDSFLSFGTICKLGLDSANKKLWVYHKIPAIDTDEQISTLTRVDLLNKGRNAIGTYFGFALAVRQSRIQGDFDYNDKVDFSDFLLFVANYGYISNLENWEPRFDLDGDGVIAFGDFLIFASHFGTSL